MIKHIEFLSTVITLLITSQSLGQVQSNMIREYYACNYHEGRDITDLMAARDNLVKEYTGNILFTTFLWTPVKTDNETDFLWFNQYESIEQWGDEMQSDWGTSKFNGVNERFTEITDCVSGIVNHSPLFQGGKFQPGDRPIVVSYACDLRDGGSMQEVNAAAQHLSQVLTQLGTHQNFNAYIQTPLISSSGRSVFMYGVYPGFSAYGRGSKVLMNSSAYASVTAHFQSQLQCDVSLWEGQVIIQP